MKYIIFEDDKTGIKEPVIFGEHTTHSQVKVERAHPVSAGFFTIDDDGIYTTFGDAASLGLKPDNGDAALLYFALNNYGTAYFLDFLK